jgi:predicted nucleic acid-binding protein
MTKILIDSDVILDFFLDREPFADYSERIFEKLATGRVQGYVTTAALLNIYYIARKTLGHVDALDCMRQLLATEGLDIFAVEKRHIQNALDSSMSDFEDAVQAAIAEIAEIDCIVTRNLRDFRSSSIPAVLPEKFLTNLK